MLSICVFTKSVSAFYNTARKKSAAISSNVIAGIILFALLFSPACVSKNSHDSLKASPPQRIITFAPSLTETVYALHAENLLVGTADFSTWPESAKELPKVGSYLDPSFENILKLKPDLVLLLRERDALEGFLDKSQIRHMEIANDRLSEIISSFSTIGKLCNREREADSIIGSINAEIITMPLPDTLRPRVLFIIGRDNPGAGSLSTVWAAGSATFYSEIIYAAGGITAISDSIPRYPQLGTEGILSVDPDIVIDLCAATIPGLSTERCLRDWYSLHSLRASQTGSVYCPLGTHLSIPGPRIGKTIHDIRAIIAQWESRQGRVSI